MQRRQVEVIPGITNWEFADTKKFNGDILKINPNSTTTELENHCLSILVLFCPFRKLEDLKLNATHLAKLQQFWSNLQTHELQLLRNIQDIRNAASSKKHRIDPLEETTEAYHGETNEEERNEEEQAELDQLFQDFLLSNCVENFGADNQADIAPMTMDHHGKPTSISFLHLRDKGAHKCGYQKISKMSADPGDSFLIEVQERVESSDGSKKVNNNDTNQEQNRTP